MKKLATLLGNIFLATIFAFFFAAALYMAGPILWEGTRNIWQLQLPSQDYQVSFIWRMPLAAICGLGMMLIANMSTPAKKVAAN